VTETVWFALIAVLALAGWGATLVAMTKASVSSANAMKVLQQIGDREDTKVGSMVDRLERMRNRGKDDTAPPNPARETQRERENPMAALFRGVPVAGSAGLIDEQPDSNLEVVET
jgi:hypothetical protein